MNILTKNRIIEKGDEYHIKDGRWMPVPDKDIGLQIMFSKYKEVRRPTEQPPKTEKPISPDSGATTAKAESNKQPVPSCSGAGTLLPEPPINYLPTVVSKKAHKAGNIFPDPIFDATGAERTELQKAVLHNDAQMSAGVRRMVADMAALANSPPPVTTTSAKIDYSDLSAMPNWIGRNGTFKATGMNVERTKNGLIQLRPIGKRGLAKNALIEIPVADVPKLIARLIENAGLIETKEERKP